MLLLSRVCAEFRGRNGEVIYRVTPSTRLTFQEAPDSIREDPLFQMLIDEGSIEAPDTAAGRKKLESEPLKGSDPSGRKPSSPKNARKGGEQSEKQLTNSPKQDIIEKTADN